MSYFLKNLVRSKLRRKSLVRILEDFNFSDSVKISVAGSHVYTRQAFYFLLAKLEGDNLILDRALREEAGKISQIYSAFRHYLAKSRVPFEECSFS